MATAEVRQEIISRVYVPDSGLDPTGEVGLPALELTTDEGGLVLQGDEAMRRAARQYGAAAQCRLVVGRRHVSPIRDTRRSGNAPAHDPSVCLWFFNAGYNVLAPFWQSTAQEGQPASLDLDTRDGFYANLNAGWPWSRVGPPRVRRRSESP